MNKCIPSEFGNTKKLGKNEISIRKYDKKGRSDQIVFNQYISKEILLRKLNKCYIQYTEDKSKIFLVFNTERGNSVILNGSRRKNVCISIKKTIKDILDFFNVKSNKGYFRANISNNLSKVNNFITVQLYSIYLLKDLLKAPNNVIDENSLKEISEGISGNEKAPLQIEECIQILKAAGYMVLASITYDKAG